MSTRSSVKFKRLISRSNITENSHEEELEETSNRVQLEVSGVLFLIQAACCSLMIFFLLRIGSLEQVIQKEN